MGDDQGHVSVRLCLAVASSFLPAIELTAVLDEYAPALSSAGVSLASRSTPGASIFLVVTGGTERRMLDLVDASGAGSSVVLVAYPGRNSLPASLEVLARLQQDGIGGQIVFLDGPSDEGAIERLRDAVDLSGGRALGGQTSGAAGSRPAEHRAKPDGRPLAGRRVGLIGEPSDWLVASSPDSALVRGVWGAEVVEIGLAEVMRRMDDSATAPDAPAAATASFVESFAGAAGECREPSRGDLESSGRIYAALRSLVEEHRLDALTVRCFDLVTDLGATGCLALSRLTDEGVVAGCEGDLVSALGLLWAREETGETPWMANPARVDIASNTLTLAHCTVPCSITESYALRSHFESGLGAAVAGTIPNGPVTLVRIGGRALDRVWVVRGEIVASGCDERMCRTQADVRLAPDASVTELLGRPLGNHLVLVRGHHTI